MSNNKNTYTSIKIYKNTRETLCNLGTKAMSYDDIINMLIESFLHNNSDKEEIDN